MKASEIRDMSIEEIRQRITENETSLQALRFQHAIAQLEDPMIIRRTRREIARLRTILRDLEATESSK